MSRARRLAVALTVLLAVGAPALAEEAPVAGPAAPLGAAAHGCLQGGAALPASGPGWQVLRPDHNRFWGHPALVAFLTELAAQQQGEGQMLIGDMSLPRGGRMPSGHASHQTGLDADILFRRTDHPLTDTERDDPDLSPAIAGGKVLPGRWGAPQRDLLRAMASDPRVERIFVNPVIKRHLCQTVSGDRGWLQRIRPWWGHAAHFHVRLACPAGAASCESGPPLPPGDGCGTDLAWWFTPEAAAPATPTAPLPLVPPARYQPTMPAACKAILSGY